MDLQNAGLQVARDFARWHIGDALWADEIIRAYLNPEAVAAELREEKLKDGEF